MISVKAAVAYTFAAGCAVFLCRSLPFLIIRTKKGGAKTTAEGESGAEPSRRGLDAFLSLVERVVPPAAMTVLAVNSIAAPVKENPRSAVPVLAASALSLIAQFWKGNFLLSILGGTALYMVLTRVLGG
ncbi:MAG: AzlD domain-containing protein [Spirochaetaceae bacterium]|jgi:branched-subunit amino acid transport protein AzlD|nr:AzlD domain-containing protein [Spirochaetaceae bacterium]